MKPRLKVGDKFQVLSGRRIRQYSGQDHKTLRSSGSFAFKIFMNEIMYSRWSGQILTIKKIILDQGDRVLYNVQENGWGWSEDMIDWSRTHIGDLFENCKFQKKFRTNKEFNKELL